MKTKFSLKPSIIAACVAALLPLSTQAATPHLPDLVSDGNRWLITYYDDGSTTHNQWATQGLCFIQVGTYGTHTRYVWYSDTYPDWNGRATQEGDKIVMHGDFWQNAGHDGMEWEIVTSSPKNIGAGHWSEWLENSTYGITAGFGNAKLQRVGKCTKQPTPYLDELQELQEAEEFSRSYIDIPYPLSVEGKAMVHPSGNGLTNDIETVLKAR